MVALLHTIDKSQTNFVTLGIYLCFIIIKNQRLNDILFFNLNKKIELVIVFFFFQLFSSFCPFVFFFFFLFFSKFLMIRQKMVLNKSRNKKKKKKIKTKNEQTKTKEK